MVEADKYLFPITVKSLPRSAMADRISLRRSILVREHYMKSVN